MAQKGIKDKKTNKILEYMKKNSIAAYVSIGIALFLLTIMITAQVTTISKSEAILEGKRESELADSLVRLQTEYDELKKDYEESQEIVEEYQTNSSTNDTLIA